MSTTTVAGGKKAAAKSTKAASAVKPDAEGRVEGVLLAEVKLESVDANLTKFGLSTAGTLPERVQRLVLHFRANTPRGDLGDCNTCKGDSNVDETVCPTCPYCGVGGVVDAPKVPAPVEPSVAVDASPAATPPGAAPALPAVANPPPPVAGKGKADKLAATAPATPAPPAGQVYTVADLDAALAAVEAAKKGEVGCYWDHGWAIHDIFSKKLYLQRRAGGKSDKPLYETWGAFAEAELGITGGTAFRMMDVAVNYDRDTAIRIGVKKLNALLRIEDPAKRVKLLEGAEKLTVAEVEEKVAKVVEKEQAGKTADRGRLTPAQKERNTKGTKAMSAAAKAKDVPANVVTPPGEEKITAALALGRTKIPLFVKGSKAGDAEAKRAKRLADGPVGFEETVNGVRTTYTVSVDAKGALVLVAERKRV